MNLTFLGKTDKDLHAMRFHKTAMAERQDAKSKEEN